MEQVLKVEMDRYRKALDMTLALSKERPHKELVALYLSGSYLRGDFIPLLERYRHYSNCKR